jgi:ribonuclease E
VQALDDEDRDETATAAGADIPVAHTGPSPHDSSPTAGPSDNATMAAAAPAVRQSTPVQPIEKAATASAAAAVSAAVPAVTAFNLPPLPPIPDVVKSATATAATDEQDVVTVTSAAAPEPEPQTTPFTANSADSHTAVAPAVVTTAVATPTTISRPVSDATSTVGVPSTAQPIPTAAPATPTPASHVAPAPATTAASSADQAERPADVTTASDTIDTPETPAPVDAVDSLPLPEQGDLLAQPVTLPAASPVPPATEESEPAMSRSRIEPDAHEGNSRG